MFCDDDPYICQLFVETCFPNREVKPLYYESRFVDDRVQAMFEGFKVGYYHSKNGGKPPTES